MSEANVIDTQGVNEAPPLDEALREFALTVIPACLGDERIRPNTILYVLHRAEELGLIERVPATADHISRGAKNCEIGRDDVWVMAERLEGVAA